VSYQFAFIHIASLPASARLRRTNSTPPSLSSWSPRSIFECKLVCTPYSTLSDASSLAVRLTTLLLLAILFFVTVTAVDASQSFIMQGDTASVRFDASQEAAAKEILRLYPSVRSDLERVIPWSIEFSPTFVLLTEGELEKMAESRLVTALAIPRRNLVLLDLSKMSNHAFVLETTMKHELCHLLLHHYINENALPKWFDEGMCQWVSNGMADIIMERKASYLDAAVLAGQIAPLWQLNNRFPGEDRSLVLAYEQSLSIVTYISQKYGTGKLLSVLNQLRNGNQFEEAVKESLGIGLPELESNWQRSLRKEHTWLLYVSMHLYEILFFVAALLTVGGFIRSIRRRRASSRIEKGEEEIHEG
jgi:peptidase MA superfamily protein